MAFFELQLELFRRAHRSYRRRVLAALCEQLRGPFLAKDRRVVARTRAPVTQFMLLLQQCREHGLVARGVKLPFQLVRELEVAPTRKVRSGGAQEEGSAAHAARHIRVRSKDRVGLPVVLVELGPAARGEGVQLGWEGQRAARVPALHALLVVVPRARGADFVATQVADHAARPYRRGRRRRFRRRRRQAQVRAQHPARDVGAVADNEAGRKLLQGVLGSRRPLTRTMSEAPGLKLTIVGPSGSGKSTLSNFLSGSADNLTAPTTYTPTIGVRCERTPCVRVL